jgi:hypothetical protein
MGASEKSVQEGPFQKNGEEFTGTGGGRILLQAGAFFRPKKYFNHVRWCAPILFSGLLFWPASKKPPHN